MTGPDFDDVRMRGFHRRIPLAEALDIVWDAIAPPGTVDVVTLREATGRLLAGDIHAPRPVPSFDRSAMDGYAVVAAETFSATAYDPAVLQVLGESLPDAPFDEVVRGRRAVRIMTGAPMPEGADAVVPAEFAEEARGFVSIAGPVAPGRNRSLAGEDIAEGALAVAMGRLLRPQDVGVIAALGLDRVPVAPRPRVSVLATGNELVRPGAELGPHQVYDANSSMLSALVERWGGRIGTLTRQPDDPARITRALGRLLHQPATEMVLVTGGTSVGVEDRAPAVLDEAGRILFHGVAMRPASPVGFGVAAGRPVFLLPGNPVSCLSAFDLLVGPALRRLQGQPRTTPYALARLPLAARLASEAGRTDYARVVLREDGVAPVSVGGASVLSSATRADGFVVVPPEVEGWDPGEVVEVHLYG